MDNSKKLPVRELVAEELLLFGLLAVLFPGVFGALLACRLGVSADIAPQLSFALLSARRGFFLLPTSPPAPPLTPVLSPLLTFLVGFAGVAVTAMLRCFSQSAHICKQIDAASTASRGYTACEVSSLQCLA